MEGNPMSVKKRGNIWHYKFRWHWTENGERKYDQIRRSAKTRNKREAKRTEEEHRAALRRGDIHPSDDFPKVPAPAAKPMTLREYANVLLRHVSVSLHRKPRTIENYRECLQRIERFPRLALAPINSVTADMIEAYIEFRRTAPKGNTQWAINGELGTLRRILRFAEQKGQILKAPAIHVRKCDPRSRVLSPEEEAAYLAKAFGDLLDAAILGIETGLRPNSELFALRWENVTPSGLRVIRGKTDAAVRTVPLSPYASGTLEMRRARMKSDSPFVFPSKSESGHLITLNKAHAKACRAAGLKHFPIYTFRHTFGTRCAESRVVDRYTLARWMGHASPSITAGYYVHISERHEQAGFEKLVEYTQRLRAEAFEKFVGYTEKLRAEAFPLASQKVH
jgi:integrase